MTAQFKLYTGSPTELGPEVTEEYQAAAWIVLHQGKILQTLPSDNQFVVRDSLDVLTHFASGHFDGWSLEKHFPKYPVKIDESLGFVLGEESLNRGTEYISLAADGLWYAKKNGKVVLCPPPQQVYHNRVNWILAGCSVAINLPPWLGTAYIQEVISTLGLGTAAWDTRREKKQARKEQNDLYDAVKPLLDNDIPVEGIEPKKASLWVTHVEGHAINMYEQPAGSKWGFFTASNLETPSFTLPWPGSDKEVSYESFKVVSESKATLRVAEAH